MVYFGRLKGLSRKKAEDWSRAYLERVALSDKAATRVDKLSGGQQQKIQLGVTIMNDPELLILDETTQGFDPVNRRLLMDIIDDQKRAGATVIMVTYQMEEVERLCDRVLLLKDGAAEAYGTVEDVQDSYGGTIIAVQHSGPLPASDLYDITLADHDRALLAPRGGTNEADILRELVQRGVALAVLPPREHRWRRYSSRSTATRTNRRGPETMSRHHLSTVIGFEFFRTVKKKRFWITTLAIPAALAVVFALVIISNQSTSTTAAAQKNARFSFTYTDASGLVTDTVAAAYGGTRTADSARAIADVKAGSVSAYFVFPADPVTQPVHVYAADEGIFQNGKYAAVAQPLLVTAAEQRIGSPQLTALIQGLDHGKVTITSQTYRDGKVFGGLNAVIPPMLFLLIFYVSIILVGNQMLSSTLEEKQNRVTEMILTTLNPTTLIIGKVVSLFIVGLLQMLIFALPVIIGYLFFRSNLNLPNVDLSHLSLEPGSMVVGALLLLGGFILFTGTLVAVGAVIPTVKDASSIFGSLMVLIFIPFLGSQPDRERSPSTDCADIHLLPVLRPRHCHAPQRLRIPHPPRMGHRDCRTVHVWVHRPAPGRLPFPLWIHRILQEALNQRHPPSP